MSDPVEVEARARCPHHATPERHSWYNECPLCRMPARFDGSGPDGELIVTLVGRDALVMAWARLQLKVWRLAGIIYATDEELAEFVAADRAAQDALAALRTWDAGTEGGGSDG